MEAWFAEFEMVMGQGATLTNHTYTHQEHPQNEASIETTFDQHLAATLGKDFPYPLSSESNTSSPQLDFDWNDLIEPFPQPTCVIHNNDYNNNNNNNNNNKNNDSSMSSNSNNPLQSVDKKGISKKQMASGGAKRKRQPSQVQDHIIAERKRRELLSRMFISLSAMVPGLKKVDKTSVLGEAIKYLKQLQEKVKVLEDVAARRTVESVGVVRKSRVIVGDDDGCDDDDNGGSGDDDGGNVDNSLPEIEVKVSGETLLLRVYCEKQKGILPKLFAEVEKHDMSVVSCSAVTFESLTLDITAVLQVEKGVNKNVKDFMRALRSALLLSSKQRQGSN